MSDSTDYKWKFDLVEYSLTTGVSTDYTARVNTNNSLTVEDIAAAIAAERTDLREDTIIMVAKLIDAMIIDKVCKGNSVVTGSAIFQPAISGLFSGTSGAITDSNTIKVNINPSSDLRSSLEDVTAEFSGNVKELGGASIDLVTDVETDNIEGDITPGGSLVITGSKIRVADSEDGATVGCVRFINIETNEQTDVTKFATNTPKKVIINVPSSLSAGTYTIQIITSYSNGAILLKAARTIEYRINRTVS